LQSSFGKMGDRRVGNAIEVGAGRDIGKDDLPQP
jgi:hypothetical protein